ncbi:PAS domain-containing sensor histidine kinase, partial [Methylogaea oryzae]
MEEASRYTRSLIEASLDPLVTISVDGKIMDVNRATEAVTGVARDQLIGSDFSDYFTEPEQARAGYRQVFSQGSVADYPLAIRHASGKITDVLYNACVYNDREGKVAGVFAAARDVTEQKRQAIAMEEASRYTRSLIEASLDPLVTISVDGKIMDVNHATEAVTGVAREQLIGSDFCDYFTEPEQARAGYRQVFSQGSVADYPLAIRHASGKITDVLYNACVYNDREGKVAGVFAAARDVTEQKRQQEALRQSSEELKSLAEELRSQSEELKAQNEELRANQEELRAQQEEMAHKNQALELQGQQLEQARQEAEGKAAELERANRYKSEFLANMSHELRTPLNSVLILAKDLAENAAGNLSTEQVESASVIHESGNQLLTLINDILDLSKIEAGRLEVQSEDFLLADVFAYLRRVFTPLAEKKAIAFEIDAAPSLPGNIRGDQQRLIQVLTNLLSNAVKFTEAGSVKLTALPDGDALRFEIQDTGIGIPPDKLDLIFGAFQQMDGSTARKYGGSGLGLTISRRLAALMGGEITVSSTPG